MEGTLQQEGQTMESVTKPGSLAWPWTGWMAWEPPSGTSLALGHSRVGLGMGTFFAPPNSHLTSSKHIGQDLNCGCFSYTSGACVWIGVTIAPALTSRLILGFS